MKLEEFIQSVEKSSNPPPDFSPCLQALWWTKKGDWHKAHDISQEIEEAEGSWIHAHLHRVEGDLGNAAYWYSRAGKAVKTKEDLNQEWELIVDSLLGSEF